VCVSANILSKGYREREPGWGLDGGHWAGAIPHAHHSTLGQRPERGTTTLDENGIVKCLSTHRFPTTMTTIDFGFLDLFCACDHGLQYFLLKS
jgi:hypothetical protein